jgi:hypothetical protein
MPIFDPEGCSTWLFKLMIDGIRELDHVV